MELMAESWFLDFEQCGQTCLLRFMETHHQQYVKNKLSFFQLMHPLVSHLTTQASGKG